MLKKSLCVLMCILLFSIGITPVVAETAGFRLFFIFFGIITFVVIAVIVFVIIIFIKVFLKMLKGPEKPSSPKITTSEASSEQLRFCPNCGSNIEPEVVFCPYCGAHL